MLLRPNVISHQAYKMIAKYKEYIKFLSYKVSERVKKFRPLYLKSNTQNLQTIVYKYLLASKEGYSVLTVKGQLKFFHITRGSTLPTGFQISTFSTNIKDIYSLKM